MTTYDIGDQVRITVAFATSVGTAVDPTTVVCTVRNPSGVLSTPSVTHPGTGSYYADITITEVGEWAYRFTGTGALIAAAEGQLYARKSRVLAGPFEP